eukprot:2848258-Rhodomonas_salina.1
MTVRVCSVVVVSRDLDPIDHSLPCERDANKVGSGIVLRDPRVLVPVGIVVDVLEAVFILAGACDDHALPCSGGWTMTCQGATCKRHTALTLRRHVSGDLAIQEQAFAPLVIIAWLT